MDKTTFAKYGWVIITVVVLAVVVVSAPQLGKSIYNNTIWRLTSDIESYSVTLDPNGGEVPFDNIVVVPGKIYGYIPNATNEGHVFLGWYTEPSGGSKVTSQTTYNGVSDHTLYAQWE